MTQQSPRLRHVRAVVRVSNGGILPEYQGARVQFWRDGDVDAVAMELGRQILAMANVVGFQIQKGSEAANITVDVVLVEAYPSNALIDHQAFTFRPKDMPALPPASPPARSVDEDRIAEIRDSIDALYTLVSNHADREDWKSAFVGLKAVAGMLENIVDEAGV